jgi:hypothetical protein
MAEDTKDKPEVTNQNSLLEEMLRTDAPEEEVDLLSMLRRDCGSCGGVGTVQKDPDNIYVNTSINFKMTVPGHVCSSCDVVVYEPDDYLKLLEAEEAAQGRPYVKVVIKNGRVSKHSVH